MEMTFLSRQTRNLALPKMRFHDALLVQHRHPCQQSSPTNPVQRIRSYLPIHLHHCPIYRTQGLYPNVVTQVEIGDRPSVYAVHWIDHQREQSSKGRRRCDVLVELYCCIPSVNFISRSANGMMCFFVLNCICVRSQSVFALKVVLVHCEAIRLTKRVSPLCVPAIISSRIRRDNTNLKVYRCRLSNLLTGTSRDIRYSMVSQATPFET